MKNTLADLNNYLFEAIERLVDDELTDEQLQKEIARSKAVTTVATTVIQSGHLALETVKQLNECGIETPGASLPALLGV